MLAKIIPLRRLPKAMHLFDYTVPQNLCSKIRPGQLITIPFRSEEIFGLVYNLEEQPRPTTLKDIKDIVFAEPLVSAKYLNFITIVSSLYGVALATLAKIGLPPPQKRKLKSINLTALTDLVEETNSNHPQIYHLYHNDTEHKNFLLNYVSRRSVIIVPEIRHIDEVFNLLPKNLQKKTVTWHSQLSEKDQFSHWFFIRNAEKQILIGTRGTLLLPLTNFQNVIIDYEHNQNHKHWDQAPRFHAKDVAGLRAKLSGFQHIEMSFSPSCSSYYFVSKQIWQAEQFNFPKNLETDHFGKSQPRLINITREPKNFSPISQIVEDAIVKFASKKKDIVLIINRRGFATAIVCQDCGRQETCPNCQLPFAFELKTNILICHYCKTNKTLPLICAACASSLIQFQGIGAELVEKYVRKIINPNSDYQIIRIESNHEVSTFMTRASRNYPIIIIGTAAALPHVDWQKTGLITLLDLDRQLAFPEFTATEEVWHLIQEIQFHKEKNCDLYIETRRSNHFLFRSLLEPDRFYRSELNYRGRAKYPPYVYLSRYFYGHSNQKIALEETTRVLGTLKIALTESKKYSTLQGPIETHPRYFRKKFWYAFVVKTPLKIWQEEITFINNLLPENWKIDPNPISILSP